MRFFISLMMFLIPLAATANSLCSRFEPSPNGPEFWQRRENYCQDFENAFITDFETILLDDNDRQYYQPGDYFFDEPPIKSLNKLFISMYAWTPDKKLPSEVINLFLGNIIDNKDFELLATINPTTDFMRYLDWLNWLAARCEEAAKKHKVSFDAASPEASQRLQQVMQHLAEGQTSRDVMPTNWDNARELQASQALEDELSKSFAEKGRLQGKYRQLLKHKALSVASNVYGHIFRAHVNYLQQNSDNIQLLLANYYKFTEDGLSRYQDDLDKEWLDLMPSSFYFIDSQVPNFSGSFAHLKSQFKAVELTSEYQALYLAINEYHALSKVELKNIPNRIKALTRISALAGQCNENWCQNIAKRAELKATYIKKLREIRGEAWKRAFHLPRLQRNVVVNVKTDILRDIDPAKRRELDKLFETWETAIEGGEQLPDFFLWLEGQDTFSLTKDLRHIVFTPGQKIVRFDDKGFAFNSIFKDATGHVMDGRYVYNIDEDSDLYILPAFETLGLFRAQRPHLFRGVERGALNHDTLLGGANILVAGIVQFDKGKIVRIDTNSGHYRPQMWRHLRPALAQLLQKHPNSLDPKTIVSDYEGKINLTYEQFLKATPQELSEERSTPTSAQIAEWLIKKPRNQAERKVP